jgi:hypothetical protein
MSWTRRGGGRGPVWTRVVGAFLLAACGGESTRAAVDAPADGGGVVDRTDTAAPPPEPDAMVDPPPPPEPDAVVDPPPPPPEPDAVVEPPPPPPEPDAVVEPPPPPPEPDAVVEPPPPPPEPDAFVEPPPPPEPDAVVDPPPPEPDGFVDPPPPPEPDAVVDPPPPPEPDAVVVDPPAAARCRPAAGARCRAPPRGSPAGDVGRTRSPLPRRRARQRLRDRGVCRSRRVLPRTGDADGADDAGTIRTVRGRRTPGRPACAPGCARWPGVLSGRAGSRRLPGRGAVSRGRAPLDRDLCRLDVPPAPAGGRPPVAARRWARGESSDRPGGRRWRCEAGPRSPCALGSLARAPDGVAGRGDHRGRALGARRRCTAAGRRREPRRARPAPRGADGPRCALPGADRAHGPGCSGCRGRAAAGGVRAGDVHADLARAGAAAARPRARLAGRWRGLPEPAGQWRLALVVSRRARGPRRRRLGPGIPVRGRRRGADAHATRPAGHESDHDPGRPDHERREPLAARHERLPPRDDDRRWWCGARDRRADGGGRRCGELCGQPRRRVRRARDRGHRHAGVARRGARPRADVPGRPGPGLVARRLG